MVLEMKMGYDSEESNGRKERKKLEIEGMNEAEESVDSKRHNCTIQCSVLSSTDKDCYEHFLHPTL